MYKWCRSACAALALLLMIDGVYAETVADMYAATVPVAEQSNVELQRAASSALREVLVRVSGRSDVVRNSALTNALSDAARYLDQYRYERNNETGALPWLARLRFDQNAVAQLLRGAGQPIWAGNRPVLNVWLVVDDGTSRQFVDEQSPIAIALREQAQRRGVTLRFPHDFSAVQSDDVWQLDASKLRSDDASSVLLLGRVVQAGDRWSGAWTLFPTGQQTANGQQAIESQGDNLVAYLAPSIDRIVDALAQQYAASTTAATGVSLRVVGIENFNDYAALLAYLKQAGSIKGVSPTQIRGTEIVLQLKLEGSPEQLARQLALDNRLTPEAVDEAQPTVLNYRWQAVRG